jgi:hypothetical protein
MSARAFRPRVPNRIRTNRKKPRSALTYVAGSVVASRGLDCRARVATIRSVSHRSTIAIPTVALAAAAPRMRRLRVRAAACRKATTDRHRGEPERKCEQRLQRHTVVGSGRPGSRTTLDRLQRGIAADASVSPEYFAVTPAPTLP